MSPQTPDSQVPSLVGDIPQPKTELAAFLTLNQRSFLAAFSRLGTISHAATAAGIDRRMHGIWLTDPAYKRAFLAAKEEAAEYLEAEARRRAVEGVDEPDQWWFDKEANCFKPKGYIKRYSDTLLIFLMKGAMPDRYRERVETTSLLKLDPKSLTPEQVEVMMRAYISQFVGDDPALLSQAMKELEAGTLVVELKTDPSQPTVELTEPAPVVEAAPAAEVLEDEPIVVDPPPAPRVKEHWEP